MSDEVHLPGSHGLSSGHLFRDPPSALTVNEAPDFLLLCPWRKLVSIKMAQLLGVGAHL